MRRLFLVLVGALALGACGGGGGGGGSSAAAGSTPALALSPASLSATFEVGESVTLPVDAVAQVAVTGTVYVVIQDSNGVINPIVPITSNLNGSQTATFQTSSSLAAGTHTGNIEVRLCRDAGCTSQYPGSPVLLPYTFTVANTINLLPLSPVAGLTDWASYQGNAAHNGYAPVSLSVTNSSVRWRWLPADTSHRTSPAVTADGAVFVTTMKAFSSDARLYAINEADKSLRWSRDFGAPFSVNHPATAGSAVYVATGGHSSTAMWSFAVASGTQNFKTSFSAQWPSYWSPVVSAGNVYFDCGNYGGMCSMNSSTGVSNWETSLAQVEAWSPAVDASFAYANTGGTLKALNLATGTQAHSIAIPGGGYSHAQNASAVLVGGGNVLVRGGPASLVLPEGAIAIFNRLSNLNPANATQNWSVSGSFTTDPVVAGSVVFSGEVSQLQARDLATGAVLWSAQVPGLDGTIIDGNIIVTDNLVFFSTRKKVYAISRSSPYAVQWSYHKPGRLALSPNGVLYVSTTNAGFVSDSGLTAINLK